MFVYCFILFLSYRFKESLFYFISDVAQFRDQKFIGNYKSLASSIDRVWKVEKQVLRYVNHGFRKIRKQIYPSIEFSHQIWFLSILEIKDEKKVYEALSIIYICECPIQQYTIYADWIRTNFLKVSMNIGYEFLLELKKRGHYNCLHGRKCAKKAMLDIQILLKDLVEDTNNTCYRSFEKVYSRLNFIAGLGSNKRTNLNHIIFGILAYSGLLSFTSTKELMKRYSILPGTYVFQSLNKKFGFGVDDMNVIMKVLAKKLSINMYEAEYILYLYIRKKVQQRHDTVFFCQSLYFISKQRLKGKEFFFDLIEIKASNEVIHRNMWSNQY